MYDNNTQQGQEQSVPYQGTHVNIDEITEIGQRVPVGRYSCRLIACEGKLSKKSKPMVQATWEVLKGEHEGSEITLFYSLSVTQKKDKRGTLRTYASGIVEMKAALAASGNPVPANYQFPLDMHKAAQLYAKACKSKIMDVLVTPDSYDEKDESGNPTGKKVETTRAKLVASQQAQQAGIVEGLGGTAPAAAAKPSDPSDPFADL